MSNEEMIGMMEGLLDSIMRDEEEGIKEDIELVSGEPCEVNDDFFDDLDDESEVGGADGYHNEIMRKAKYKNKIDALRLCEEGLKKYPENIDLLADAIRFSGEEGEDDKAEHYLKILLDSSDMCEWSWMQFTYVFEYLMNKPMRNAERIKELIINYKKYLPEEEKAVVAECEFEEKIGNHEKARELLEEFVQKSFHAPQCATKLITLYMKIGDFEKAQRMQEYYEIASNELQSSTNYSIQLYESVLVEHSLLRKKRYNGEVVTVDEYKKIKKMFERLLQKPQIVMLFGSEIKDKIDGLDLAIIRITED